MMEALQVLKFNCRHKVLDFGAASRDNPEDFEAVITEERMDTDVLAEIHRAQKGYNHGDN